MKEVTFSQAVSLLKNQEILILPTDTIYGICGDATSKDVAEKIYSLKKRPKSKKFVALVDSVETAEAYFKLPEKSKYFLRASSGMGLSIAVPEQKNIPWVGALRIPSGICLEICKAIKKPVIATSANISGEKPLEDPAEISRIFNLPVLNLGKLSSGPSTVYDPLRGKILRGGAFPGEYLKILEVLWKLHRFQKRFIKEKAPNILKIAKEVLEKVRGFYPTAVLGGSIAKGTFVEERPDIDIFVLFPPETNLEEKFLEMKKKLHRLFSKIEIKYSQHPYLRGFYKGFWVEVVPALDVKPHEAKTAADRSRWHVKFVKESMDEFLLTEAGILKRFLKANDLYGSDLKHLSLSGYAVEVLVWRYGSALKAMLELASWIFPKRVEDPVDLRRDVVASLHRSTLEKIKALIVRFFKDPSPEFFFKKEIEPPQRPFWLEGALLLEFEEENYGEDAIYGRIMRILRKLERNLPRYGFRILGATAHVEGKRPYLLVVIFPESRAEKLYAGPPESLENHVRRFIDAHSNVFKIGSRYYAAEPPAATLQELLEKFSAPMKICRVYGKEKLVEVWPGLPEALRKGFIELVLKVVDAFPQKEKV